MNTKILTLTFVLCATYSFTRTQTIPNETVYHKQVAENAIYQLFPTKNIWTFIKLDTRNGKMWQVHFSISDSKNKVELTLNSLSLITDENEIKGRFTLYPTENMYNFLLLDQIDGTVFQVQWSMESKNRGIISIIKSID